jgi:O-antigen/teichoic acid export membrane protein
MAGLRALTLRGGLYTAMRQVVGMAMSFAGLALLVRLIGAKDYGVYVSAFAIYTYALMFLGLGIDINLVRQPAEPSDDDLHQAFTLALAAGGAGLALALPGAVLVQRWIGVEGVLAAMLGLFAVLPLQIATLVPAAVLQRRLDYRRLAAAELAGLAALYAVALPVAALGGGALAAVAGYWAQQGVIAALLFPQAGYRPGLRWRPDRVRAMIGYGAPLSAAIWMWHARFLVNPLVVARVLGPEAAAAVGIAIRIAESLSFMRTVAWRVAIPAMGRVQDDKAKLAAAIGDGIRLQLLVTGPAMAGFSLVAPWLIPWALGRDLQAMVALFPFIGLGYLVNSVFCLHFSALHVTGRNGLVAASHFVHVALLFAAAAAFTPMFGLLGYGLAEVVALGGYAVAQALVRRCIGRVDVTLGLVWAAGFALPLFAATLGPWAWAAPFAVLALPATRQALSGYRQQIAAVLRLKA